MTDKPMDKLDYKLDTIGKESSLQESFVVAEKFAFFLIPYNYRVASFLKNKKDSPKILIKKFKPSPIVNKFYPLVGLK